MFPSASPVTKIADKDHPMRPLLLNRRTTLAVLVPLCLAAQSASAFDWFPRNPGALDQLYLVQRNNCDDFGVQIPVDNVVLTLLDAENGVVELSADSGGQICPLPPPWDSYVAVPIPAEIGGVQVRELVMKLTDLEGTVFEYSLPLPRRLGIPPSIAGTWFFPWHSEQGFLINVSRNPAGSADVAVTFNTYGADGMQRWHSGIAPIDATDPTLTIPLIDTGTGVFFGTATTPDEVKTSGEIAIEYLGCGELHLLWDPEPYTGLRGGGGRPTQLTQTYSDPCDLDGWMEQIGGQATVLDVEVTPVPADA